MNNKLILKGIGKSWGQGINDINLLNNVSLEINSGDSCAIVGPSGSGKSTLLNIIGLLDRADKGEYIFFGHDINRSNDDELAFIRNNEIGFIFQSFNLMPGLTALDNIAFPLRYSKVNVKEARQRAALMLANVGLSDRAGHFPAQLSGGQRQRVAIARALINQPSIIVADEPTGNLDGDLAREIMRLLLTLNAKGTTLLVVTHDMTIANSLTRCFVMKNRQFYERI